MHLSPFKFVYLICVWNGKFVKLAMSMSDISNRAEIGFIPYSNVNIESVVTLPKRRVKIVLS